VQRGHGWTLVGVTIHRHSMQQGTQSHQQCLQPDTGQDSGNCAQQQIQQIPTALPLHMFDMTPSPHLACPLNPAPSISHGPSQGIPQLLRT
jgi:hypothetical protein